MVANGSLSVSSNDMVFDATGLPPNELGRLIVGRTGAQTPYRDGFICLDLSPGVYRLNAFLADAQGNATVPLDYGVGTASLLMPGQTRTFHIIYRDCMSSGAKINATNGIQATFAP